MKQLTMKLVIALAAIAMFAALAFITSCNVTRTITTTATTYQHGDTTKTITTKTSETYDATKH